jgi:hypothetical protein
MKGYFLIEADTGLVKISPTTESFISLPAGKGYKNMMIGIMPDDVTELSITLRLENSGPYSAPQSSPSPTIYVSVMQGGIVVLKYSYYSSSAIQTSSRSLNSVSA